MTPGLPQHFPSTLHSPFCLSSQKPSENGNKRPQPSVGREWTALRQANLSLLRIFWPQHSLLFFSLTLCTNSLFLLLSNKHSCFLTPLCDIKFSSFSLEATVRRTVLLVLKYAKNHASAFSSDLQSALSHTTKQEDMLQGSSRGTVLENNCTYNL